VLEFFRRWKRVTEPGLPSPSVTGQYKKSDESTTDNDETTKLNEETDGKKGVVKRTAHRLSTGNSNINLSDLFHTKSSVPVSWNSLKRLKVADTTHKEAQSQVVRHKKRGTLQKDARSCLYLSSPSLLDSNNQYRSVNKRRSEGDRYYETGSDVLQYTNWDAHGSLITLNFGEEQQVRQHLDTRKTYSDGRECHSFMETRKDIAASDCDSDIYEEIAENEDSGTFCDSDSGISSLYETIVKYQTLPGTSYNRNSFVLPETIKENDELDDDLESHLMRLNVDLKFVHVFQRNYHTKYKSKVFKMEFDVLTNVPICNNHTIRKHNNTSEIKRALLKTALRQQQVLRTMISRMKTEKVGIDDSLRLFNRFRIKEAESNLMKKYDRFLDQMDPIINLIFGLELKIANLLNLSNEATSWKVKLEEAIIIKDMHDKKLEMLVNNLDLKNQSLFRERLKLKEKIICEIRIIEQELYYIDMQLKILFMYSVQ